VIMYAMLCGYTPFYGEDQGELFESIMSGRYEYDPDYWSPISGLAKDLIDQLLTYHPERRITAKAALKHPWFESAANTDLLQNVRANFPARATFKKAVTVVQGINRLMRQGDRESSDHIASMIADLERVRATREGGNPTGQSINLEGIVEDDEDDGTGTQLRLNVTTITNSTRVHPESQRKTSTPIIHTNGNALTISDILKNGDFVRDFSDDSINSIRQEMGYATETRVTTTSIVATL